ncbi:protein of unknown function [Cupriavidus neocaledonicus]|uniref:Uncharacterized protein n=1 Tax=Cupriavidus neocaledonicus TaxID=1040979 RepID=A0A375H7N7_9BURK|nr:hypothetical protein CBM2605_A240023 [Cupriavidus neocaledonicus]SPD47991.1 protein of unknown function [Cupriavidus neocaledonicus]SPD48026.1 protein of unknown function [Cupriavidus neocaledonicus]
MPETGGEVTAGFCSRSAGHARKSSSGAGLSMSARRAFQQDTAAHHSHDRHALRRFAGWALRLLVLPGRMGHIVPNRKGAPSKTLIVK